MKVTGGIQMKVTLELSQEEIQCINIAVGRERNFKPTRKLLASTIHWILNSYLEAEICEDEFDEERRKRL